MCTGIKACEILFFFVTSFRRIAERLKLILTTVDIPIISIYSFHPFNPFLSVRRYSAYVPGVVLGSCMLEGDRYLKIE